KIFALKAAYDKFRELLLLMVLNICKILQITFINTGKTKDLQHFMEIDHSIIRRSKFFPDFPEILNINLIVLNFIQSYVGTDLCYLVKYFKSAAPTRHV